MYMYMYKTTIFATYYYVSSYYFTCVLIRLHMCPDAIYMQVENNDLRNNVSGPCLVGVQSQHLVSVTGNLTA